MINHRSLTVVSLTLLLAACGQSNDSHDHDAHSNTPQTEPGVWPPVLAGIANEQPLPGSAFAGARSSIVNAMRASVLNNPQVKQALGANYREFEASLSDAKSDSAAAFLFFNYENNTTVEASFFEDGTVTLVNTAAAVFQPAEHEEEVQQAIDLAEAALTITGYDVGGLTGTAMLAHPPITQIQNVSESFYPERFLYVTFGPGNGQLPEYSALVNLSAASVTDAKLIN